MALPLIALAILLALGGDRASFQRDGGFHHELSAKSLAIAENLSPEHNFRLTTSVWRDADYVLWYTMYGRFPIGVYALAKLAGMPFGSDLAAALLAARVLMLALFCGAALFCYLAIARITGSRWIAFAATAFAFSGFYALHYADAVASETSPDLFGAMLAFHGMVVFVQEGRFRQLLVKTCAALLLGWHVYALILPFALWGFGGEAFAVLRSALASGGGIRSVPAALGAIVRSRFAALAAASILFGSALLGFNLLNEYAAFRGELSLSELPALQSALNRTSLSDGGGFLEGYARTLADSGFWGLQLMRAGVASVPYALAPSFGDGQRESPDVSPIAAGAGVLALGAALGGLALVRRRRRVLMAALALFGFFWAVPMKGVSAVDLHYYEGIYHIGIPLTIIAAALTGARAALGERWGARLAAALGAAFAVVFALSVFHESRVYEEEGAMGAELDIAALSELREMRDAVRGGAVLFTTDIAAYVPGMRRYGVNYALGGATFDARGDELPADFVISRYRDDAFNPLTPDNRFMFLYGPTDPDDLRRAERRRLEASEPAARSAFDVYLADGALRYLKAPCAQEDALAFFFLHVFPADAARFRGEGDPTEFRGMNFRFDSAGKIFDGACMATAPLPDHPIAAIRTGQYISDRRGAAGRADEDSAWQAVIAPPPSAEALAAYESAYQTVADGEPAARSGFDLHLEGDALIYLKQPCSEEDARGRFWLSVHPADVADLPAERRDLGHESLNFDFVPPHGAIFNGKCMAARQLPDYEIAKIATGQDAPDAGRLWTAEIAVGE